jgi:hypothetical protein
MAPMIPSYDDLDETRLEEILRERAFAEGADLWVGQLDNGQWRAAYRVYVPPTERRGVSDREAAVGSTKRAALIGLVQIDDIGTVT